MKAWRCPHCGHTVGYISAGFNFVRRDPVDPAGDVLCCRECGKSTTRYIALTAEREARIEELAFQLGVDPFTPDEGGEA